MYALYVSDSLLDRNQRAIVSKYDRALKKQRAIVLGHDCTLGTKSVSDDYCRQSISPNVFVKHAFKNNLVDPILRLHRSAKMPGLLHFHNTNS